MKKNAPLNFKLVYETKVKRGSIDNIENSFLNIIVSKSFYATRKKTNK